VNTNHRHDAQPGHRRTGAASRRPPPGLVQAAFILVAIMLGCAALRDAHAGTYKWTDDKGIVHYADKMPADAVNRANVQLDAQGMALKKTDAAPTLDQLRAKADDVDKQSQTARERQDSERRDRALLSSYTREDDIELARTRALATIDGQLQSARIYSAQLTRRQQELLEKKIAGGSKGVPPAVERELESIDSELAKTNEVMALRKKEAVAIGARYDGDKQRWRELQQIAAAAAAQERAAQERDRLSRVPSTQVGGTAPTLVPAGAGR